MAAQSFDLFLGIDGGGSACRLRLEDSGGFALAECDGGAANVSTDFDGAIAQITTLWHGIAADLGISDSAMISVHAGLAGAIDKSIATKVRQALPFQNIGVSDDRLTSLVGALGGRDGILISVGTGSFVAAQSGGAQRFLGGWGSRIGDQASGAWLGRRLLEEMMLAEDGLRHHSTLSRMLLARFSTPEAVVTFANDTARLASLAPDIVDAADAGDPLAEDILAEGMRYLLRAVERLGHRPGTRLVTLGGLGKTYAARLPAPMADDLCTAAGTALDGAVHLAGKAKT